MAGRTGASVVGASHTLHQSALASVINQGLNAMRQVCLTRLRSAWVFDRIERLLDDGLDFVERPVVVGMNRHAGEREPQERESEGRSYHTGLDEGAVCLRKQ